MASNELDTTLRFLGDPDSAIAAIDLIVDRYKSAARELENALKGVGGGDPFAPLINGGAKLPVILANGEAAAVRFAQAQARLQVAAGNSAQAEKTLGDAIAKTTTETTATLNARRQLLTVEAQAATAAGKAETALLREAQAIARLQQQAGNSQGAIKTLADALDRVGNRNSLPALRAELQKTYLNTDYANSPLISAIRGINQGASTLTPQLSSAANAIQLFAGGSGAASASTLALGVALGGVVVALGAIAAGAAAAASGLYSMAEAGIALNAELETTRIGIATVIASVAEIRNSEGVQLKGIDAINAALPVAADQLRKLRIDALETSATFQEIAPAFQAAFAPGLRAGLTIDQIRENTVRLTQAVAAVGLPLDQIKQETRAILSGEINRNTQAATALGITREAVLEAQKQGKFAEFLEQKLSAAAAAGKLVGQTFTAAVSNLKEAGDTFQGVVTEGLFDQLRDKANQILPQIFDKKATNLISKNFEGLAETFTRIFDTAGQSISKAIDFIFEGVKQISAFLDRNQETVAVIIESINSIAIILGEMAVTVGEIILGAFGGQKAFEGVGDAVTTVARIVGFVSDLVKIQVSLFFTVGNAIRVAVIAPLELAVTILARMLDFIPIIGKGLMSLADSLRTAREAATSGLANSATQFGNAVADVGKSSEAAIKRIEEARRKAGLNQRAVAGLDRKTPGATGATFRPPARGAEDAEKGAAAKARQQAQAELKLQQQLEKQQELINKRNAAALQASLQDRLISLETYTELAIENDRELLNKRLASLDIEEKAAIRTAKNVTDAEAKKAEFALKRATLVQDADIKAEEQRDNLRRTTEKAEEDHQKRLLDIREIGRKAQEASIRDAQNLNVIGAVEAENRIIEIERQRFDERERLLRRALASAREDTTERQKINDELIALDAERAAAAEDAARRIRNASLSEIDARVKLLGNLVGTYEDLQRAQIAAAQAQAAAASIGVTNQRRLAELSLAETRRRVELIELDSQARQEAIKRNAAQLAKEAFDAQQGGARLLEIERLKNAQLKAERDRARAEKNAELEAERQKQLLANPASPLSIFGQAGQLAADQGSGLFKQFAASANEALASVSASATNMQGILQGAFSALGQGLGNIVQAFVLTGQTGPAAFKKLAAGVIAGIASQASVKAIFELAEGIAALARAAFGDPRAPAEAALHFKAAAIYGTVAGVAAVAGRAVAGGGGGGGTGGQQFVQTGQFDRENRTIEQGGALPGRSNDPSVLVIRVEQDRHSMIEVFDEDYRNNGRTRARVRTDVVGGE